MVGHTNTRRGFLTVAGIAGLGAVVGSSSGNTDTGDAEEDDPDIVVSVGADGDLTFDPEQLPLSTGETVEFEWKSDGHNLHVTHQPDDADWEGVAEAQDAGYTHSQTFEVEGWYTYVCEPHEDANMEGTILACDIERPTEGAEGSGG